MQGGCGYRTRLDRPVAASLRALPGVLPSLADSPREAREMFVRAGPHGVAGVVWDAWKASGIRVEDALATSLEMAALARELDHEAHLRLLHAIDAELTVPALVLKGPLFARRYYPRPSSRPTSDIDLLVAEAELGAAADSLAKVGYRIADSPAEIARSTREHHHLHLTRPESPLLELHFHAYRGFGVTLRTEMLAERSVAIEGFARLRVAAPPDELVYLAAHAGAHRFMRLGWLYDLELMVARMTASELATASSRAREWGFSRVLALAGELLVDVLGVSPALVAPLGTLPRGRRALVRAVVAEPRARVWSAATRFAYTTLLADSGAASMRYLRASSARHARRLLGRG